MFNITFPSFTFDANPNRNYLLLLLRRILASSWLFVRLEYNHTSTFPWQISPNGFHAHYHQTKFMKQSLQKPQLVQHKHKQTYTHLSNFRRNRKRKRSTWRRRDASTRCGSTKEVEIERQGEWRGIGTRTELRQWQRRRQTEWQSWDKEEEARDSKWIRLWRQYIFVNKMSLLTSVFLKNQCCEMII